MPPVSKGAQSMGNETIVWLHPTRGFGFIKPDVGDQDVYVHAKIFRECGVTIPLEGQRLSFEVGEHNGRRRRAVNLQIINEALPRRSVPTWQPTR